MVAKDVAKVTKSHILGVNAPTMIVVHEEHGEMDQNGPHLKCGRQIGKRYCPSKMKGRIQESTLEESIEKMLVSLEKARILEEI